MEEERDDDRIHGEEAVGDKYKTRGDVGKEMDLQTEKKLGETTGNHIRAGDASVESDERGIHWRRKWRR